MTKPSVHPSLGNSGSAQRPCEVSQGNLCFLRRDGNHWIFCSGKKCPKRHRGRAQRRHLWNNSTRARATRRVLGPLKPSHSLHCSLTMVGAMEMDWRNRNQAAALRAVNSDKRWGSPGCSVMMTAIQRMEQGLWLDWSRCVRFLTSR